MEFTKPNPFTPKKNQINKDWEVWKKEFKMYLKLSGGYEKFSEEQRAFLLINLMGTEAFIAMNQISFDDPENDVKDMDILIQRFDQFFNPPLIEAKERFKFFSRRKSDKESIEDYIAALKVSLYVYN